VTSGTNTLGDSGESSYFTAVHIASGAVLTHPGEGPGLGLDVSGNLTIEPGGRIDVTGQGYGPESGPASGSSISGSHSGGGGGYGGKGGDGVLGSIGGPTYGSSTMPVDLGSGGGRSTGGSGGGATRLEIGGTLTVDGSIIANGSAGTTAGLGQQGVGGGSGGSIYIVAQVWSGSGAISANGGPGMQYGGGSAGGGGGGRIAVYYQTNTFMGTLSAIGGTGTFSGQPGGNGTILQVGPDTAPVVVSANPSGYQFNPIDHVDVTFSHPIDPATFTATDVSLSGSRVGPILITGVSLLRNDNVHQVWRISFAPQVTEGVYTVRVGPDITNLAGISLDQDLDGLPGETSDDVFQSTWVFDYTGPQITRYWPRKGPTGHVDHVDVYFSEPIYQPVWPNPSFTVTDVTITRPDGTTFQPTSIQNISGSPTSNGYQMTFPALSTAGLYTVTVGPDITDLAGNLMDQNGNGIPGEAGDAHSMSLNVQSPDLIPRDDIQITGAPVAGRPVTITYTVDNTGIETAIAPWTDSVFISADGQWDVNDPLFAQVTHVGDVPSGSFYTETVTANWPGVVPGQYHVIIRPDSHNTVPESDETNNLAISIDTWLSDVDVLPVYAAGDSTPGIDDILNTQRRAIYYQLTAIEGEDLLVTLNPVLGQGYNELYIRYGEMPTRSEYDAKHEVNHQSSQAARIPGTIAGTYYVLACADVLPPGGTSDFNIKAEYLAFNVTNVTPNIGGNVGDLTVKVVGARFTANCTTRLVDAVGQVHAAAVVYFEDAATIYPTFDLRGFNPGAYDLEVEDENSVVGRLPGAITVVDGGGADLQARLIAPSRVRRGRQLTFFVEYENAGNVDMIAPMLIIDGPSSIWLADDPSYASAQMQIMGISFDGPAGILRPGTKQQVEFQAPSDTSTNLRLRSITQNAKSQKPIDWNAVWSDIRPSFIDEAYWNEHQQEIAHLMGTDWDIYISLLADHATLLNEVTHEPVFMATELFRSLLLYSYWEQEAKDRGSGSSPIPSSASASSTQSYNRNAATSYATHFYKRVCSDGYFLLNFFWPENGEPAIRPGDVVTCNGDTQDTSYGTFLSKLVNCLYGDLLQRGYSASEARKKAQGADCAHFVSDCLSKGGVVPDSSNPIFEYPGATGIANAGELLNWLVNNVGTTVGSLSQL
jgi:hypothetical protein